MLYYLSESSYTARTEGESVSETFLVGKDRTHVEPGTLRSRSRIDDDGLAEVLLNLKIARSRLQRLSGFRKIRLGPWWFLALGCCLFCRFRMFVGCLVLLFGFGSCCFDVELSSERAFTLFGRVRSAMSRRCVYIHEILTALAPYAPVFSDMMAGG